MTKTKVYLAGSSQEPNRVLEWAKTIRENSRLTLVSTWQDHIHWGDKDASIPRTDQKNIAALCLSELRRADVVFCLWTLRRSVGSCFELGYAHALNKPVIVAGKMVGDSIFTAALHYRDPDEDLAYFELNRFARDRQAAQRAVFFPC